MKRVSWHICDHGCRIFLLAAIISLSFLFLDQDPVTARDTITLQLAWKHQFQFAGYYAAHHKGFYQQAGLAVAIIEGGEGRFAEKSSSPPEPSMA